MSQRVTIVLDSNLMKKLRLLQAKKLRDSNSSVSFSKVVNQTLVKGLSG